MLGEYKSKGVIDIKLFRRTKAPEKSESILQAIKDLQNNYLFNLFNKTKDKPNEVKAVTPEQAMEIPVFAGCVDLMCSIVASLQIKMYEQVGNNIKEITTDERLDFLNNQTGDLLNSYDMKYAMTRDYLIHGDGHAFVNKERNKVQGLYYVENGHISVMENHNPIFKDIKLNVDGEEYEEYEFINFARNTKNGVEGVGIVEENNLILTLAYNQLKFECKLIGNGGFKRGVLTSDMKLTQEVMDSLKEDWKSLDEELMVLNKGLNLKDLQQTSVELQLNESKKINNEEIAKIFLPLSILLGTATDDTYNNFINTKIVPLLAKFQANINRAMILAKENKGKKTWFAFDIRKIYRGDKEKQYKAYEIALKNGFMTIDEVRYEEDLPDLDLNFIKMSLGEILYNTKTKEIYTPNTDTTSSLMGGGEEKNESGDKDE